MASEDSKNPEALGAAHSPSLCELLETTFHFVMEPSAGSVILACCVEGIGLFFLILALSVVEFMVMSEWVRPGVGCWYALTSVPKCFQVRLQ